MVHPLKGSLEAMAIADRSSLSVKTWKQFGAAAVEFHVSKFIETEEIDPSVAGDGLGQLLVVGGFDQLVHELGGEGVADPVAGLGGGGAEPDKQM